MPTFQFIVGNLPALLSWAMKRKRLVKCKGVQLLPQTWWYNFQCISEVILSHPGQHLPHTLWLNCKDWSSVRASPEACWRHFWFMPEVASLNWAQQLLFPDVPTLQGWCKNSCGNMSKVFWIFKKCYVHGKCWIGSYDALRRELLVLSVHGNPVHEISTSMKSSRDSENSIRITVGIYKEIYCCKWFPLFSVGRNAKCLLSVDNTIRIHPLFLTTRTIFVFLLQSIMLVKNFSFQAPSRWWRSQSNCASSWDLVWHEIPLGSYEST